MPVRMPTRPLRWGTRRHQQPPMLRRKVATTHGPQEPGRTVAGAMLKGQEAETGTPSKDREAAAMDQEEAEEEARTGDQ